MARSVGEVELKPHFPGELMLLGLRDPLSLLLRMAATGRTRGAGLVRARVGARELFLLCHPDLVRAMLSHTGDELIKERALRLSRIVLGNGLVTSDGELHRRQRRLLLPGFHQRRVAGAAEIMVALTQERAAHWHDGTTIAVDAEMGSLTLEIAARALFGADLRDEIDELQRAVLSALTIFDRHRNPLAELLNRLPLPGTVRVWRARARIDETVRRLIEERRQDPTVRPDLLSILLGAREEESNRELSDRQIRDEVVTLLLTGHETTALALTWTWYYLARHPDVEARLHAEVDAVLADRDPTFDDVKRLAYTRCVVSEAMRLRPPVWAVSREVVEAVEIGGRPFSRGATLVACQYVSHRDPAWWRDPEEFQPGRFAARAAPPVNRFIYYPFSGGHRGCIGEHFAWTECLLVVAVLARRWRFEIIETEPVGVVPSITLRPDRPVQLRAVRR